MASSDDPSQKKAEQGSPDEEDAAAPGAAKWPPPSDFESDSTQIHGMPQWTAGDPTGFADSTQSVPRPSLIAAEGSAAGDETHVGPATGSEKPAPSDVTEVGKFSSSDWGSVPTRTMPQKGPTRPPLAVRCRPICSYRTLISPCRPWLGTRLLCRPPRRTGLTTRICPRFLIWAWPLAVRRHARRGIRPAKHSAAAQDQQRPSSTPPPRTSSREKRADDDYFAPDDMSLPEFAPVPVKRNLTLVGMQEGDDNPKPARRALWPFVTLFVLAAAAVGAFAGRDAILAVAAPKKDLRPPAPVTPSSRDLAKVAFADGVRAYGSKEYPKAIESFERAVTLDSTLSDAQRSLGIVYATIHDQAKAVDHYRKYLLLTPAAADAVEVQKIVDDYAKAQQPKTPEPAAAPEKPAKKLKAKRRGRR